ncbi:MAG: HD domain-containing protein [Gemmatimonadetes bacterium]|nr:HD domain-containing protein [Gemmatimonadota bacterium]
MAQPTDIPSLPVGARLQDTLLVLEVDQRSTGDGSPFTVLTVGNATGSIDTEPFWLDRQPMVAGVRRGHVAQVIGEVETYRDRTQLKVSSLRVLPKESVDVRSLLPSVGGVDRYWATLDHWRAEIRKSRLKRVVDLFYEDPDFRHRYGQCPASVRRHHAAIGGLLQHTTEVAAIARTIARASGGDSELVLAGVLLHDIGKLESYRWDGLFDYTEAGSLLGHVVLGALMLDRRVRETTPPPCTEGERDILLHLILSHHGRREFGSPVPPMTLEAEILHWADNASAKTADVAAALADVSNFPAQAVSGRIRALEGRRLFKGSSDWGAA